MSLRYRHLAAIWMVFACQGVAQITENQDSLPPEMTVNQKAFLNLPEEQRKEFIENIGLANRMFQQKRVFECLEKLDEAEKVFALSPEVHNLRGSCYVEMRAFDKALDQFERATELSPNNTSLQFNIAEVYFVTREWSKALEKFYEVQKATPQGNVAMSRLIEFKILLCLKKLGRAADAEILAQKYDFLDDSPFYYYANATMAFERKEQVKAEEWLGMAARIFRNPAVTAPWQDTLVEYGYIKSFYGGEDGGEE